MYNHANCFSGKYSECAKIPIRKGVFLRTTFLFLRMSIAIILILLLSVALTACNRSTPASYYDNDAAEDHNLEHGEDAETFAYDTPQYPEYNEDTQIALNENAHINAGFISDVEHLLYILDNNFALSYTAYWGRGVDIAALASEVIYTLKNSEQLDNYQFESLLQRNFFPLYNIGHFNIWGVEQSNENVHMPYELLFDAEEFSGLGLDPQALNFAIFLASNPSEADIFFASTNVIIFLSREIYQAKKAIYEQDIISLTNILEKAIQRTSNMINNPISMEILEEDKIAYLRISSFDNTQAWNAASHTFVDFYNEISHFEHLIIDLQGNEGGHPAYFTNYVLLPLWQGGEIVIDSYFLTLRGEYSEYFLSSPLHASTLTLTQRFFPVSTELAPLSELLQQVDLPELQVSNRNYYTFHVQYRFNRNSIRNQGLENNVFNGRVWLLIDSGVGSAGHLAAWVSKESRFATLVGTPTGGNFGGNERISTTLPYSGTRFQFDTMSVLDSRGYAIEAGIHPHHYNFEGMDALETVLLLIESGY